MLPVYSIRSDSTHPAQPHVVAALLQLQGLQQLLHRLQTSRTNSQHTDNSQRLHDRGMRAWSHSNKHQVPLQELRQTLARSASGDMRGQVREALQVSFLSAFRRQTRDGLGDGGSTEGRCWD